MAGLLTLPFFDVGAGISPADGALLYFNVVGSETDKDTYTTAAATTPHANPVVANSKGVFPAIYLTGDYDWVLTDKNSVQINAGSVSELVTGSGQLENVLSRATLAAATADVSMQAGLAVSLVERSTGNGGGAKWDVIAGTGTANGMNIVAHDTLDISFVLRTRGGWAILAEWGVIVNDVTIDHAATIIFAFTLFKSALLPPVRVKVTKPVVVPSGCTLWGIKDQSSIDKTTATTYTSSALSAITSGAAVFIDYSDPATYNFRSKLSSFDIYTTSPTILDCGLFVGKTSQSVFEDINISTSPTTATAGVLAESCWMSSFSRIRVGSCNGYAFDFTMISTGLGTSLLFDNCYAEACGGGITASGLTYSTMNSCGFDYINSGGRPGNDYGSGAGGDYQAVSNVYRFSACDITITGCGTENSSANFLYNEGSSVIFNTCKADSLTNYVAVAQDVVGIRGTSRSNTEFNACDLAFEDTIGNARGLRIETPAVQKLKFSELPRFTGFGTGKALFSGRYTEVTGYKSKIKDRCFTSNVLAPETPFTAWYENGSHVDNDLTYIVDTATGSKTLRFSGDTGAAGGGTTISTHWRYYINQVDKPADKLVLSIKGTYATGGFGNPSISIREAANTTSVGTLVATYPVADLAAGDYLEVDLSGVTLSCLYLDVTITYKDSYVNAEIIDLYTY
jgi:hypothetical protein